MQKSNAWSDLVKEKQYVITIPFQIRNIGKLNGAVFLEFGETECLTLCNSECLYFLEIVDGNVAKYSSIAIPGITSIISIIKGYLLIITQNQKLWLLQVKKKPQTGSVQGGNNKIDQKENQKILTVQSFLKQVIFHSFFLRQVTPNMIQLFISCPFDRGTRMIYVYQFTVNQKIGGMGFTVDKNMKIIASSRKQLYASKNYFDPSQNSVIKLKNFSDSTFSTKKIQEQYLYIFPICKTQQFYCLNKNYEIINAQNLNGRKSIRQQLNGFRLQFGIPHMNFVIFQHADNKIGLFSVEEGGKMKLLATQSKQYNWQICFNGRLVGVNKNNQTVKVTKQLYRKLQKILPSSEQSTSLQANMKLEKQPIKQQSTQQNSSKMQQKNDQNNADIKDAKQSPQKTDTSLKSQQSKVENIKDKSKQAKQQQPEQSKTKNNFKPSKIISRKDLSKQQKQTGANPNKKQEAAPNKQKNDQQQKKEIIQERQIIQQANPTNEKIKVQKNQSQTQKTNQTPQKLEIENKKQIPDEIREAPTKAKSPFEKKSSAKDDSTSIVIPNIQYDKIFGAHLELPPKLNVPPPAKIQAKEQQQKPTQNPFHKKSESLIVNNDGTTKTIDSKQQSNQQFELKSPIRKMSLKKQQSPIKTQKQKNCCPNFQQTKQSFTLFSKKIQNLEVLTNQLFKSLNNTTEQIKNEIKQSIQKGKVQLLQHNQQKVIKNLKNSVQLSMNDYFAKKLTSKVNDYFKSVMADSKKIYDTTLKFYTDKKKQSIISLQNHFQEQQHLVNQIRLMTTDMLTCVQNTVTEGQQNHAILLKQWQKISNGVNAKLDANLESLENHTHDRSASQRQHILDSLAELKDSIDSQTSNIQSQRQELKEKQKKETQKKQSSSQQKQQRNKQKVKKKTKVTKVHEPRNYYSGTPYGPYYPY